MSSETSVTHLTGQDPDGHPEDQAALYRELHARIERILEPGFPSLSEYLRAGVAEREHPYEEIIDGAAALAEVLSAVDTRSDEITDACVPKAAGMIYRLLSIGQNVCQAEVEAERERHFAQLERERAEAEAERAERDNSPAGIIDVVGYLAGMHERSRRMIEGDLENLEAQDPKAAEIVRARLKAGQDATLRVSEAAVGDCHSAVLKSAQGSTLNSWKVGPETADALRPLVADESGQEGSGDE